MKILTLVKTVMVLLFIAPALVLTAQEKNIDDDVFIVVEQMPAFPGCDKLEGKALQDCSKQKMMSFIMENLKYPKDAEEGNVEGKCVVEFVVEKDGSLSNIEVIRDIGAGCGDASRAVVEKMNDLEDKWLPARQRGKLVRVKYTIPIQFKLTS